LVERPVNMSCVRRDQQSTRGVRRVKAGNGELSFVVGRRAMQTGTDASFAFVRTLLRRAAAFAQSWRKLLGGPYRPEKHYMRGPGPKWHEKYDASHGR
jgi:hypothetical protein